MKARLAAVLALALAPGAALAGPLNEGDLADRARAIDALPPSERVDARTRLAEVHWRERGELEPAAALLEAAVRDEEGPRLARVNALEELVLLDETRHALDHASTLVERYPELAPAATARVRLSLRNRRLATASAVFLAALLVAGAVAGLRGLRARGPKLFRAALLDPVTLALALYAGGGLGLVVLLRGEDGRPFFLLGVAIGLLGLVARLLGLASPNASRAHRALRALVCAAGVVAAGFLAVELSRSGP